MRFSQIQSSCFVASHDHKPFCFFSHFIILSFIFLLSCCCCHVLAIFMLSLWWKLVLYFSFSLLLLAMLFSSHLLCAFIVIELSLHLCFFLLPPIMLSLLIHAFIVIESSLNFSTSCCQFCFLCPSCFMSTCGFQVLFQLLTKPHLCFRKP